MEIDLNLDRLKYKIHKFYQNSQNVVQFHKNDIKALEEIIKKYEKLKEER